MSKPVNSLKAKLYTYPISSFYKNFFGMKLEMGCLYYASFASPTGLGVLTIIALPSASSNAISKLLSFMFCQISQQVTSASNAEGKKLLLKYIWNQDEFYSSPGKGKTVLPEQIKQLILRNFLGNTTFKDGLTLQQK